MSEVVGADEPGIEVARRSLEEGEAVVFPTDTVYGLGAGPRAAGRLFEIKGRPRELTLPVLAARVEEAREVARFDERAEALAAAFWPGGLTIVLPRAEPSAGWDLGEHRQTVGVRVPDADVARALLSTTGPLAVTSANPSGEPTGVTCEEVRAALGEGVAVYVCAGAAPGGTPSTVVDLTGELRVLRPGAVPAEDVARVLARG